MTNVTRRGLLLASALLAFTMPAFAQQKDTYQPVQDRLGEG